MTLLITPANEAARIIEAAIGRGVTPIPPTDEQPVLGYVLGVAGHH